MLKDLFYRKPYQKICYFIENYSKGLDFCNEPSQKICYFVENHVKRFVTLKKTMSKDLLLYRKPCQKTC